MSKIIQPIDPTLDAVRRLSLEIENLTIERGAVIMSDAEVFSAVTCCAIRIGLKAGVNLQGIARAFVDLLQQEANAGTETKHLKRD